MPRAGAALLLPGGVGWSLAARPCPDDHVTTLWSQLPVRLGPVGPHSVLTCCPQDEPQNFILIEPLLTHRLINKHLASIFAIFYNKEY